MLHLINEYELKEYVYLISNRLYFTRSINPDREKSFKSDIVFNLSSNTVEKNKNNIDASKIKDVFNKFKTSEAYEQLVDKHYEYHAWKYEPTSSVYARTLGDLLNQINHYKEKVQTGLSEFVQFDINS